jgi:hypothetical protein
MASTEFGTKIIPSTPGFACGRGCVRILAWDINGRSAAQVSQTDYDTIENAADTEIMVSGIEFERVLPCSVIACESELELVITRTDKGTYYHIGNPKDLMGDCPEFS